MRKLFALTAMALLICGLIGGEAYAAAKKPKIMLSMALRDQWLSNLEAAAKAKAKELGVDLAVQDANSDFTTQISHVQTARVQGYGAMIVNLVETTNAEEIIGAAGDMKLVFVNRCPDESLLVEGKVVYVGSDEFTSGKMQGDFLSSLFKKEGKTELNAVLLQGTLGLQHTTARTASAKKAFADNGIKVKYVFEDTADYDRSKAMEKFIQFMGKGQAYDVVVCNNDEMALGVIEAMKTQKGKVLAPVVGIDANASAVEAIEAGDLACSVFQDAKGQGGSCVEAALKLMKGEKVKVLNWVPFELVHKGNVNKYKGANKG